LILEAFSATRRNKPARSLSAVQMQRLASSPLGAPAEARPRSLALVFTCP